MGIGKTFVMDCDKCGQDLTDSDGVRTAGREAWLIEFADDAGWKFLDNGHGWYCAACVIEKSRAPAPVAAEAEKL